MLIIAWIGTPIINGDIRLYTYTEVRFRTHSMYVFVLFSDKQKHQKKTWFFKSLSMKLYMYKLYVYLLDKIVVIEMKYIVYVIGASRQKHSALRGLVAFNAHWWLQYCLAASKDLNYTPRENAPWYLSIWHMQNHFLYCIYPCSDTGSVLTISFRFTPAVQWTVILRPCDSKITIGDMGKWRAPICYKLCYYQHKARCNH